MATVNNSESNLNPYLDQALITQTQALMSHNQKQYHIQASSYNQPQSAIQSQSQSKTQSQPKSQVESQSLNQQSDDNTIEIETRREMARNSTLNRNAVAFVPSFLIANDNRIDNSYDNNDSGSDNVNGDAYNDLQSQLRQYDLGIPFEYDERTYKPKALTRSDFINGKLSISFGDLVCVIDKYCQNWEFNRFNDVDIDNDELYLNTPFNTVITYDLTSLPLMLLYPKKTNQTAIEKKSERKPTNLTGDAYKNLIGKTVFIQDENGMLSKYKVLEYDINTSEALLETISHSRVPLRLDEYQHSIENDQYSNRLEIRKPTIQELDEYNKYKQSERYSYTHNGNGNSNTVSTIDTNNASNSQQQQTDNKRLLPKVDDSEIRDLWQHGKLTKTLETPLCWKYNKNSLLRSLTVATIDTRFTNLDYRNLMFISGFGLSFNWIDIESDNDEESIQEEALKYLSNESDHSTILDCISKHSGYKIFYISPNLTRDISKVPKQENLESLENIIIQNLKKGIATLTNDQNGHISIIVGYLAKPDKYNNKNNDNDSNLLDTKYFFKIKKMVAKVTDYDEKDNNNSNSNGNNVNGNNNYNNFTNSDEYETIDLLNQKFVMLLFNPRATQPCHLVDQMTVKVIYDGLLNFVNDFNSKSKSINDAENDVLINDLKGKNAIEKYIEEIKTSIDNHDDANYTDDYVNDEMSLSRNVIYTLVKFLDCREAMYQFFERIIGLDEKIDQIQEKWVPLHKIKQCLTNEIDSVKNSKNMFINKYVLNYNGLPLPLYINEWNDKKVKKNILDIFNNILKKDESIMEECQKLAERFEKHI